MNSRKWTPGWRRTPPGLTKTFGDHLLATASIANLDVKIVAHRFNEDQDSDLEDDTVDEVGGDVTLSIKNSVGKKFSSNLSAMTEEELDTLENVLSLAIATARSVVVVRDRVAEEAALNGEDIYYRRHRASPRLSVFERSIAKHAQSIPRRSSDDVGGDGTELDSAVRTGEDGGGLAEPDAPVSSG